MNLHIVLPCHLKLLSIFRISTFYNKLIRKDIRQLRTIPISSTDNSPFVIIVVATGEKMPENELRNVNLVLLVHDNGNTLSVVHDCNASLLLVNGDFDLIHFLVPLVVVCSVHQHFVKDLVKSRSVSDLLARESDLSFGEDPFLLFTRLDSTDVCVRSKKDVLKRGFLLVNLFYCFFLLHRRLIIFIWPNSKL